MSARLKAQEALEQALNLCVRAGLTVDDMLLPIAERVESAAFEAAKLLHAKVGRPRVDNLLKYGIDTDSDSDAWLEGRKVRSTYSIAKEHAAHIEDEEKRKEKEEDIKDELRDRYALMFLVAELKSRDRYPYYKHIHNMERMAKQKPSFVPRLEADKGRIAEYRKLKGNPGDMTMTAILNALA